MSDEEYSHESEEAEEIEEEEIVEKRGVPNDEEMKTLKISRIMQNLIPNVQKIKPVRSIEDIDNMKAHNLNKFHQREHLMLEERFIEMNESCGLQGYCCTRHQRFPAQQSIMTMGDYVFVSQLKEDQILAHGKEILNQAINYMKTLAMQGKFISQNLASVFIVKCEPFDLQLLHYRFQSTFNRTEFENFVKFLKLNDVVPPFFSRTGDIGSTVSDVAQVVQIVQSVHGLVLEPGKLYYSNGAILSNNQLLAQMKPTKLDSQTWVLMQRFCDQREAVQHLKLIPAELQQFVRYENPQPLPEREMVAHFRHGQEEARELLRLVLGMHPVYKEVICQLPAEIKEIIEREDFPIWYKTRVQQIALVVEEFVISTQNHFSPIKTEVVPDEQHIKALVDQML